MKKSEFATRLRAAGLTNRLMRSVTMKMQLDEIECFVATVERGFKSQLKVSERKWKRQPKGLSNDELQDFFNKLSQECFSLDSAFPSLVRQTSFIYLYSVLEKALMCLCSCAHQHGNLPEAPEIHKGKGIRKVNSYLKKVGGVAFPEGRDWNELCLLGALRNLFVHSLRRKQLDPALEAYIKKNKALFTIGVSSQIMLREAFCTHSIRLVRRFYADVLNALPDTLLE